MGTRKAQKVLPPLLLHFLLMHLKKYIKIGEHRVASTL